MDLAPAFPNYLGTFGASSTDPAVRLGDNIGAGYYNLTQRGEDGRGRPVTKIVFHAAFVPTRSSLLFPDLSVSVEQFVLRSRRWGQGVTALQVFYPIVALPYETWFFNNMRFPGPTGLAAIPTTWNPLVNLASLLN